MASKPTVYLSIEDICRTHELLAEYSDEIAADVGDCFHQLLDRLGPKSNLYQLYGNNNDVNIGKEQILMTLSSKFVLHEDRPNDELYVRTKKMVVDLMFCCDATSLENVLKKDLTLKEIDSYNHLLDERSEKESKKEPKLSLPELQKLVSSNLLVLEQCGYLNSEDGYQQIINAIGRDIVHRNWYRHNRHIEYSTLFETLDYLQVRKSELQKQITDYNFYLTQCLQNLEAHSKKKGKVAVKYSAYKLREKGVLQDIEGLQGQQLKGITFEFTHRKDELGKFVVSGKMMGTQLDVFHLNILDLLQLQHEGTATTTMFQTAKINVVPLIHFLNRIFYQVEEK